MKKIVNYSMYMITAIAFLMLINLTACTQNGRVKAFGGTATFELPAGQKLVNVTWKDADLWYLTRPMKPGETAETYKFQEKSTLGIAEGTFVLQEVGSGPPLSNTDLLNDISDKIRLGIASGLNSAKGVNPAGGDINKN